MYSAPLSPQELPGIVSELVECCGDHVCIYQGLLWGRGVWQWKGRGIILEFPGNEGILILFLTKSP